MDTAGFIERRGVGQLTVLFAGGIAIVGLIAATIFGLKHGQFFSETAAVVSKTMRDVFSPEWERPIFEIDVEKRQVAIRDAASAGTASAGSGSGGESQKPAAAAKSGAPSVAQQASVGASLSASREKSGASTPPKSPSSKIETITESVTPRTPCNFSGAENQSRLVTMNEIAWMGTEASASDEWIELKNNSPERVSLAGWQLLSQDENIKIIFSDSDAIPTAGLHLLERTDDNSVQNVPADKFYGGALSNSGGRLKLFDAACNLVDEIDAGAGWPAGDNESKKTMERKETDLNWHTSSIVGGTPKTKNSSPAQTVSTSTTPVSSSQSSSSQSQTGNAVTTTFKYALTVLKTGSSTGSITSEPAGIMCGADCSEEFLLGTSVVLNATASSGSSFAGWAGACSGSETCAVTMNSTTSVTAVFALIPAPPPPPSSGKVIISEILYDAEGNDTGKEFIELYNSGSGDVDLSGWTLKNGDSSLATIGSKQEDKTTIKTGGFFLIGLNNWNSSPAAEVVRSASLPNTSATIVLKDQNGTIIDSVSYNNSVSPGQSYERQPISGTTFVVQQNPNPQNASQ